MLLDGQFPFPSGTGPYLCVFMHAAVLIGVQWPATPPASSVAHLLMLARTTEAHPSR